MGAACLIVCILMVAIFAYVIAPDRSKYANTILPAIGAKPPGFTIYLLKIQQAAQPKDWKAYWIGSSDQALYYPLYHNQVQQFKDTLVFKQYVEDGLYVEQHLVLLPDQQYQIIHRKFWLGTDKFGRDMLSRLIIGTRISLSVGLVAVIIALTLGIAIGAVAGYVGGKVDHFLVWLMNVVWSIPTLLLVFAITLLLGKGFWQVFIAVGLTMWVNVARLVRGQVMAIKNIEYIQAANVLGFSHYRIIVHHILPNIMGPVMVIAASNFASAIVIEAGLSFLGVGVQPPQPSWGLMMKENYNFIITNQPFLAIIPGIAIMLIVLAFNLVGNAMRDALDVKSAI